MLQYQQYPIEHVRPSASGCSTYQRLRRYVDLQRAGFYAQQADNLNAFNGFCVFFVTFKYLSFIAVASASRVLVSARPSTTGMFD